MGPSSRLALAAALAASFALTASAQPVSVGAGPDGAPVWCETETPTGLAASPAPSLGTVRVLVARARFADDAQAPPSTDAAALEAWFDRASWGQVDVRVTQAPVVTLQYDRAHYQAAGDTFRNGDWIRELALRLDAEGFPREDADVVVLLARSGAPFDLGSATARAIQGGDRVWSVSGSASVLTHEIGHTMGLAHSGRLEVASGNPFSGERLEYGNPFDIMGDVAGGDFGAVSKAWLGWGAPLIDGVDRVVSAPDFDPSRSKTTTVRLRPVGAPGSAARTTGLLALPPEGYASPRLAVEFREDIGGVLLLALDSATPLGTTVIDATPAAAPSDGRYVLPPGENFVVRDYLPDDALDVAVRLDALGQDAGGAWADVSFTIGPSELPLSGGEGDGASGGTSTGAGSGANAAPSILSARAASAVLPLGSAATLEATTSDADGHEVSVEYFVDGVRLHAPYPPFRVAWQPDTPGAYSVRARAVDVYGEPSRALSVGLLFTDGPAPTDPVAEAGVFQAAEGAWTEIPIATPFRSPVVLAQTVSAEEAPSAPVRIRPGGSGRYSVWLPPDLGAVPVAYLAAESGTHRLVDGTTFHAGTTAVSGSAWARVTHDDLGPQPLALAGLLTSENAGAATVRVDGVTSSGFRLRLLGGFVPQAEQVGYLAMTPALVPDRLAASRLEAGLMSVSGGRGEATLRQQYGPGADVVFASVQEANTYEPVAVRIEPDGPSAIVGRATSAQEVPLAARIAYLALGLTPAEAPQRTVFRGDILSLPSAPGVGPSETSTFSVAPNPSRGTASLTLRLSEERPVRARVLDVLGREVARVYDGTLAPGAHTLPLPGGVPAGVYIAEATVGAERHTARLTVTR